MRFVMDCDMNNAAFTDDASAELARILRNVAARLEGESLDSDVSGIVRDLNGNRVGSFQIKES